MNHDTNLSLVIKSKGKKGERERDNNTTKKPDGKTDRETVRNGRRNGPKTYTKTRLTMSSYTEKHDVREALRAYDKGRYKSSYSRQFKAVDRALIVERVLRETIIEIDR